MNLRDIWVSSDEVDYYWYFTGVAIGEVSIDTVLLVNSYLNWFEIKPMSR